MTRMKLSYRTGSRAVVIAFVFVFSGVGSAMAWQSTEVGKSQHSIQLAQSCQWNGNQHSISACGGSVVDRCGRTWDCSQYDPWRRPVCDEKGACICAPYPGCPRRR